LLVTNTKLTPAGDPPTTASAAVVVVVAAAGAVGAAAGTEGGTLDSDGVPIFLRFGALPSPPFSLCFLSFPINTVSERICLHSSRITRMPTAYPKSQPAMLLISSCSKTKTQTSSSSSSSSCYWGDTISKTMIHNTFMHATSRKNKIVKREPQLEGGPQSCGVPLRMLRAALQLR
jgi:hypothetical protein